MSSNNLSPADALVVALRTIDETADAVANVKDDGLRITLELALADRKTDLLDSIQKNYFGTDRLRRIAEEANRKRRRSRK